MPGMERAAVEGLEVPMIARLVERWPAWQAWFK